MEDDMAMKKRRGSVVYHRFLAGHVVNVKWDQEHEAIEFTIGQQKLLVSADDPMKNKIHFRFHVLVLFENKKDGLQKILSVTQNPTPTQIVNAGRG